MSGCRPVPVSRDHRAPHTANDVTEWRCVAHGCACEPTGCTTAKQGAA